MACPQIEKTEAETQVATKVDVAATGPSMTSMTKQFDIDDFTKPIREAGGPQQFITAYVLKCGAENVAQQLAAVYESEIEVSYATQASISSHTSINVDCFCRLQDLGFSDHCTSKGYPRLITSLSLIDSMLTGVPPDGFVTQNDPLLIWVNPATMTSTHFWTSFIKGHTRACCALAVAIIAFRKYTTTQEMIAAGLGRLVTSLKVIRVRVVSGTVDLMSVAFQNATLTHRSSIRQKDDLLCWMAKLNKVCSSTGTTPDEVLKKYNSQAPVQARVTGQQRTSCLNLLQQTTPEIRSMLIAHASQFGTNSAFQDDAFTSKKVLPGWKPRLDSARWNKLLMVTNNSMMIMLQHLIKRHEALGPKAMKVTKEKMEKAAELSALVDCITNVVLETHVNFPRSILDETLIHGFITNDPNLVMSLEAAIMEKDANFDVMHIALVREIVSEWRKDIPECAEPLLKRMKVSATQLEDHEWNLWEARVKHDIEAVAAYVQAHKQEETMKRHKVIQHCLWRASEARNAALSLLDKNHPNCQVWLMLAGEDEMFINQWNHVKDNLVTTNVLPGPQNVAVFTFLNWACMSQFSSKMMKSQQALLAHILKSDSNGADVVAMVVNPSHTYKKGLLHRARAQADEQLAGHGLNLDRYVCMAFSQLADARTDRPFLVMATLLAGDPDKTTGNAPFKSFTKQPLIDLGVQPKAKELCVMDDPDPDSLPPSSSVTDQIGVAQKHSQIGHRACNKILNTLQDDLVDGERHATMVIDLSVHVGDMLKAFIAVQKRAPMAFLGLCGTADERDWVKTEVVDFIKHKLLHEDFIVPGFTIPPVTAPGTDVPLPMPKLAALHWETQDGTHTLAISAADIAKWKEHDSFRDKFADMEYAVQSMKTPKVNGIKGECNAEGESSGATPNLSVTPEAPLTFIDPESIQTELLHDIDMVSTKAKKGSSHLLLKICANHTLFLVNPDPDNEFTIEPDCLVAGYNRGKWTFSTSDDDKDIKYSLNSSADKVLYNGRIDTVKALVEGHRTGDDADVIRICYHTMVAGADGAAFSLELTKDTWFAVETVEVKRDGQNPAHVSQSCAAGLIPAECWDTTFTSLLWVVKWNSKKGLQPIRPQIVWTYGATTIPPAKALQLM